MGTEDFIPGRTNTKRHAPRATKIIGTFWGRNVGAAKDFLKREEDLELLEYTPGKVDQAFPKQGNFGEFDEIVGKHWESMEESLQMAEHGARWVSKHQPDVVVVWNDHQPNEVGMVQAANELGIPTVQIAHGSIIGMYPGNYGDHTLSKYLCGTWALQQAYKDKEQSIDVIATGMSELDAIAVSDTERLRSGSRKDLKWDEEEPVITWVGTWAGGRKLWDSDEQLMFGSFVQAFQTLRGFQPKIQLNVCPHPGSDLPPEWYESVLEKNGISEDFKVMKHNATSLATYGSDLLVGSRSSVMSMGALLGIPSVILDYKPWHERAWFAGKGFVLVRNPRELTEALAKMFAGTEFYVKKKKETSLGAEWFTSATDGKASKRVARVIARLARGQKPDELCYASVPGE